MIEEQNKFMDWLRNRRNEESEHAELIEDGWIDTDFSYTSNEEWKNSSGMATAYDLAYGLFFILSEHNVEKIDFVAEDSVFLKVLKVFMDSFKEKRSAKDYSCPSYLDGEIAALEEIEGEYRRFCKKIEDILNE